MSDHPIIVAYRKHKDGAADAYARFKAMAPRSVRVPGCDTVIRLAWRMEHGASIEQAAAREYLYRWRLTLDASAAGCQIADHYAPHLLGM